MPEYNGTLQAFELASTLWLIPALPLLLAVVVALGRALPSDEPIRARLADDRLAFGALAASLVLALANAVQLALLPPFRRFLIDPVWTLVRSGSLEVGLTFAFDPLAAVCSMVIALVGIAALMHARRDSAGAAHVPALALAVGGAQLLVLADNLALMLVGWHVAALAAWLLFGARDGSNARAARLVFGVARLGDAAIIGGAALLFWSLGGSWVNGTYTPDYRPRLIGVLGAPAHEAAEGTAAEPADGALTVGALPGARVYAGAAEVCQIDNEGKRGGLGFSARPCREIAQTPFWRLPLPPARHDLRIDAGSGTNQLLVDKLRVTAGEHTAVAVAGPTLVFREMSDQLRVKDDKGTAPVAGQLTAKRLWGIPALLLACALFALGALSRGAQLPFGLWLEGATRAPATGAALVAGATGTLGGVYLLARLSFYLALVPDLAGVVALIGATTALTVGARALFAAKPRVVLVRVATAEIGLAIVGVASGATSAGVLLLAVQALAIGAWFLVADAFGDGAASGLAKRAPRLARAARLATLAVAGVPWPFVGTFWSREASLWAAFGGGATGFVPGVLVAALALGGSAAVAFSIWRMCFTVVDAAAKRGAASIAEPKPPLALWIAGAAVAVGLLGATDAVVGGTSLVAPITAVVGTSTDASRLGGGMRAVLMALTFGIPLLAWSLARSGKLESRYAWLGGEPLIAPRVFATLARAGDGAGRALVALDAALDVVLGAPARMLAGAEPTPESSEPAPASSEPAPERAADRDAGRAGPATPSPSKRGGKKRARSRGKGKG